MLLDGHGVVRPALHGGVVGHEDALLAVDHPDPGHYARGPGPAVVEPLRCERGRLEEGRARVADLGDPLPGEHLPAVAVPEYVRLVPGLPHGVQLRGQLLDQRGVRLPPPCEVRRPSVDPVRQPLHVPRPARAWHGLQLNGRGALARGVRRPGSACRRPSGPAPCRRPASRGRSAASGAAPSSRS